MGIGAGPGLSAVADGEDDEIIAIKKDPFVQLGMAAEDFCQRRTIHDGAVRVTVLAGLYSLLNVARALTRVWHRKL